jgi:hypothetical protein
MWKIGLMLFICMAEIAHAAAYRCVDEEGNSSYQDKACDQGSQVFLPLPSRETDIKEVKKAEKEIEKTAKQQQKEERALAQKRKQTDKKEAQRLKKAKLNKRRCQTTTQKLEGLRARLRQGYRLSQEQSLKRRIAEQQELQTHYCEQ